MMVVQEIVRFKEPGRKILTFGLKNQIFLPTHTPSLLKRFIRCLAARKMYEVCTGCTYAYRSIHVR